MLPPGSLRGSLQLLGVDEPAWVLLPAQPFCSETRGPSIVLWGKGETSTHSVAGSLVWVSAEALGRQASEGGAPPLALPWQCGWQLLLPSLKIRRPPICL